MNPLSAPSSPYDILDLGINATENEIKKQYRKKSLLIHPDKFKHPRGIEVRITAQIGPCQGRLANLLRVFSRQAFDQLKKVSRQDLDVVSLF